MEKQHNGTKHVEQEVAQSNILDNFDQVVNQLRGSLRTLEDRVNKRTRDLEIAAEVAKQVSTYLELDELLPRVVNLTRDSFGLYHAHIYLASQSDQNLVLAAGAGEAGQRMTAQRHRIPVSHRHSLVARAARSHEAVIVNDVTAAPDFLPNPMLPNTKSEMALPMIVGQTLIGVLDLQSDQFDRFNDEDVQVMSSLASQIAIAVQNAEAFTERRQVEEALQENQARLSEALNVARLAYWEYDVQADQFTFNDQFYSLLKTKSAEQGGYLMKSADYARKFVHPVDAPLVGEEIGKALGTTDPNYFRQLEHRIIRADGSIGHVTVRFRVEMGEEGHVVKTYGANQDITESKRQEEEIHRRVVEIETVAEVGAQIAQNLELGELLWSIANLTAENFHRYYAQVYLLDDAGENLVLAAGSGEVGEQLVAKGHNIPLNRPNSLVARAGRSHKPVVINDVTKEADFLPNQLLPETKAELAVPILLGNQLIGVLDVQDNKTDIFGDAEAQAKMVLANQIAVAVQNARAFEANQESQRLLRTVIDSTPDWIFAKDRNFRYVLVNKGYADGVNKSVEEMLGKDDLELGFPEALVFGDPERGIRGFRTDDTTVLGGESIYNPYDIAKKADGSEIVLDTQKLPLHDGDGNIFAVLGFARDITERTYATQALEIARHESEARAKEIETVAEVGAQIAQNLDLGELLWSIANLTVENFHYYYAQVYLLDEAGENLVLAAGSGEVGKQLVAKGHSIPLSRPNSLVARAGRTQEPVVINDVKKEADFLPNQLLPKTRAEIAVPILLGEQLLGILDVQDERGDAFGAAEVQTKVVLANQIAVAVQNARAFEANQESQRLLRTVIDSTPDWIFAKDRNFRYVLVNQGYADGVNKSVEEMLGKDDLELGFPEALVFGDPERGIRGFRTDDTTVLGGESIYNPYDIAKKADGAEIVLDTQKVPLRDGDGNIFAVLGFARDITQLVQAQDETRLLYEASQSLVKALSREEQLDAVVDFPRAMGAISGTLLYMDNDDQGNPEWVEIVADWQRDSGIPSTVGARYYLPHFPFSKLWMANPNEPAFISDILTDKRVDENTRQAFSATGTRGAVLAPLYLKNQWVGMLSFSWDKPVAFDERSKRIIQSLGQQAASSVYAARLLEQVQKRASDMETVAQVSAAATTVLDVNDLLRQVSDLTKERFDLYHSHVYLLDDSGKNLMLAAGAGEAGRLMKERGHRIPLNHENSLVASAARNREGVIANDVTLSPDFLPNPLLPDTRSEMAIPMVVAGELIGVLDVQSRKTNHFTAEDVRIQTSLADQIAVAVQNARSFVQVQAQAEIERQAAERLREVDRLKSEFLANMSHELRTPLNSIIGYSEVLLDGVDGELTADAVEDVEAIHGSGQHLLSIINDILDLAKIEAGQMQVDRKELAITKFLQEIVHAGQILVRDKDVKLELEEADNIPNVYADPIRLRQIIWNLVSNAVKFTEKGSVIVSVGVNDASNVYVKVRDTGIGMDKEQLPLIFEQFRQVDGSSTRRAGGTGLGLTITRHLVRMHQGEIHVDSKPGSGSTFWFTLPVYQPEHIA